jgi:hypothetical protein
MFIIATSFVIPECANILISLQINNLKPCKIKRRVNGFRLPWMQVVVKTIRIDRDATTVSEKYKKNFDVSSEGPSSGS